MGRSGKELQDGDWVGGDWASGEGEGGLILLRASIGAGDEVLVAEVEGLS